MDALISLHPSRKPHCWWAEQKQPELHCSSLLTLQQPAKPKVRRHIARPCLKLTPTPLTHYIHRLLTTLLKIAQPGLPRKDSEAGNKSRLSQLTHRSTSCLGQMNVPQPMGEAFPDRASEQVLGG